MRNQWQEISFREVEDDSVSTPLFDCKTDILNSATSPGGGGGGGSSITFLGKRLYLFGGCSRNGSCASALSCVDVDDTSSWVKLPGGGDSAPSPRFGHSLTAYDTKLVVYGGQSPPSSSSSSSSSSSLSPPASFNDLHVYDTRTNTWSCLDTGSSKDESAEEYYGQAIRPMPRNSHSVVTNSGTMILFGGSNEVGPMNDMWTLDLRTLDDVNDNETGPHNLQWKRIGGGGSESATDDGTTPWPEPREMHSACIVKLNGQPDKKGQDHAGMLLMGGRKADGTAYRDMWLFDLQTQRWRQLAENNAQPERPRCSHTSVYLPKENVVIVFGGWDGAETIFGDILCFDMTSGTWIDLDSTAIHGDRIPERFAHAACDDGTGSGLYMFGGVNAENDLQDLVRITMERNGLL